MLFVNTSNGVDEAHINIPSPEAPTFLCLNRDTGKIIWQDNSPGNNILHGQWSSPAYGVFNGQPEVLFAGGDGWLYAFDPKGENGKSKLLWKFDANPKESHYALQRATRNHLIGTPLIYDNLIYIGVGEDPEHGEGDGHLWCINPVNKGGDVSPTLVFNKKDPAKVVPHRRIQASLPDEGDFEKENPNSAAVWHYMGIKPDSDEFTEVFHRTVGSCAIKDDILYVADFSGCFHCLDARTGKAHWVFDMLAASWGSPLIVDGKVYIGDEDGDIHIFEHSKVMKQIQVMKDESGKPKVTKMPTSVYTTPVVANNILFISDKLTLYAIVEGAKSEPPKPRTIEAGDSE
jgi:outer membrane protein assembly factor BamB